jgi:Domain of unknown function (DUF4340)
MMRETTKTMAFIGTAVVVLVLAWLSRPAPATFDAGDQVGQTLYDFDPLEARRLRIVSFNSVTGEPQEFEVAKAGETWSIPSKEGYPADAEDQMAEAATAIDGKEVLRLASESAADHRLYGVLDPTGEARQVGQEGVGTRVTIEDPTGKILADVIIGKEDKDAPEHRYVRRAEQDAVFVAEISTDKLSTSFADWIEKDLLKLSPWDIQKVQIKDYSFEAVPVIAQGTIRLSAEYDYRSDMTLVYDDTDAKWTAQSLLVWDPQAKEYVEKPLSEDQQLNSQKLNDLKNSLDDLRIVDVGKKPEGLSAELQASEDFLASSNQEAIMSLMDHGFAPVANQDGTFEIASTEGEVIVTMKTGVEYVLRFGEVQLDGDAPGAAEAADPAAGGSDLNRYIFVVARFNEDAIPKPEIQDPPPLPPGLTADATTADDAADAAADEAAGSSEASPDETAEGTAEEAADGEDEDSTADGEGEESKTEELLAERKRIEEENQRKLDEYADKITQGKEMVQELNERFGDWYYVIDDAEYQKIHLSRDQVVQEKAAEDAADAAGATGAVDAAGFGRPGESIPGLPDVSGLLNEASEPSSDEPAETGETGAPPAADAADGAASGEAGEND